MNSAINFLNTTGRSFTDFSASMLIQSCVLIVVLFLIDFLIKRRVRAVFRYCIWMLLLVKLVLPPALCLPTGIGQLAGDRLVVGKTQALEKMQTIAPAAPQKIKYQKSNIKNAEPLRDDSYSQPNTEAAIIPVKSEVKAIMPPPAQLSWQAVVFLGWLVGVVILSVLLVQRFLFVKSLIAQTEPASERLQDTLNQCRQQVGIKRNIELRLSKNMLSPAACGLLNPVILMPAALLENLSREKLRAVLVHELAHIKRGDLWVNFLQTVLQIAYFYNPLLWLGNSVIRGIREKAVDEMVLAKLGDEAKNYSTTLIDIAEIAFSKPHFSLRLVGVVESKKALASRIKHILSRPFPKNAKLGFAGLVTIILAAAVLLPMAKGKDSGQKSEVRNQKNVATENTEDIKDKVTVYEVNRKVSDFPESEDFSTPESAYAAINRVMAADDYDGWKRVSVKNLAGILSKQQQVREKKVDAEWAKVVLNARILEIMIKDDEAVVLAELPQELTAKPIRKPIDYRHLNFEDGKWLNTGEDRYDTIEEARAKFSQSSDYSETEAENLIRVKKVQEALENPDIIIKVAEQLFYKIQNADYEKILRSQQWGTFGIEYTVRSYWKEHRRWMCETFKDNPITKVELGEVFKSNEEIMRSTDNLSIHYKVTLKDGGILEGDLPFYYSFKGNKERWVPVHGIDWHLQDEPIKKMDLDIDKATEGTEKNNKLVFGPVKEVTIPVDGTRVGTFFLDFESGQLISPPPSLNAKDDTGSKWAIDNGVDAIAEKLTTGPHLWGLGCVFLEIMPDQWDIITPEKLLAEVNLGHLKGEALGRNQKQPATFAFKTREGGIGVLQIIGFTHEQDGVKIRYKMVENNTATESSSQISAISDQKNNGVLEEIFQIPAKIGAVGRMLTLGEDDLLKGLRFYSEISGGKYPATLDSNSIIPELKNEFVAAEEQGRIDYGNMSNSEKKKLKDKVLDTFFMSAYYTKLVNENKNPVYYGDTVTANEPNQILIYWKKSDDKCRAVYGDLRIQTIDATKPSNIEQLPADKRFTAALPNGESIELIAVCDYPSTDKQWWQPDGKPLPFKIKVSDISGYQYKEPGYQFVFRTSMNPSKVKVYNVKYSQQGSGFKVENPKGLFFGHRAHIKAGKNKTDITLAVVTDNWTTIASHSGKGTNFGKSDGKKIIFSQANNVADDVLMTVTDELGYKKAYRLAAIANDGSQIDGGLQTSLMVNGMHQQSYTFKNIQTKQIKEYQFQQAPYDFVTIKNISLKPATTN
ncbi:MAG: M56 family metallopeptidase [Phycisphaerae bacterium]|nr:M56 family metallopeptidase [Phycisphaerae bacterium]